MCTIMRATVFYQQINNSKIANEIHGFTIDYGKFILINNIAWLNKKQMDDKDI